ncbi:MAG: histidine kinase [Burkholderiaceae bacterium]|nr:histidine kinase [Burkholderiaceae bacterium]
MSRRLPALTPVIESGVLAEFTPAGARFGLPAFALLIALGWLLFGWKGWVQHMVELWVAYAVSFLLLAWLRWKSGAWVATRPLILVVIAGPLFGAALAVPVALLPSLPEDRTGAAILGHMGVAFLFALALVLMQLSFGLVLQRQRRQAEARQRALVLEREVLASRLSVLQAQIEPHFLYNTLANVQALTVRDPAAADQMLTHLIDYLRSAMPAMRSTRSTLGREFTLAHAYLSIMRFRMGARLAFSAEVPAALADCEFPPTVVGTLVENAIKHGLEPSRQGGRIDLTAHHDGTHLVIACADTGIGFSSSSGSGVGLANARERLRMLYGPQAELDLEINAAGGVTARAKIPLSLSGGVASTPRSAEDSTATTAESPAESAPAAAPRASAADLTHAPPVTAPPEPRDAQRPAA